MPSIEIVCVGLVVPVAPPSARSFDVIYKGGLRSHRGPTPRFQGDFDEITGCLYHLGNPGLGAEDEGPFFAYDLLSERAQDADPAGLLELSSDCRDEVQELTGFLLQRSPQARLLFTTDWQLGPVATRRFDPRTHAQFWRDHDEGKLLLNASYPIALEAHIRSGATNAEGAILAGVRAENHIVMLRLGREDVTGARRARPRARPRRCDYAQ